MSDLFQIYESDLQKLEHTLPKLMEHAGELLNRPEVQVLFDECKEIVSNVRWNYGPPTEIRRIEVRRGGAPNAQSDVHSSTHSGKGDYLGAEGGESADGHLRKAAQAVVDRWDTPLWKDVPHTGEFISALRKALGEPPAPGLMNAKRYEWLRSGVRKRQGQPGSIGGVREIGKDQFHMLVSFHYWCSPEELDAAIDAAMKIAPAE